MKYTIYNIQLNMDGEGYGVDDSGFLINFAVDYEH